MCLALPVLYLRQLRGGGVPPTETDLGGVETLLLRHFQLDKLGRTVAAMRVEHTLHCMLPRAPFYPLKPTAHCRRPHLQPTLSFFQTLAYLSPPPVTGRLLSSGCGSSTSVQPSFLLNNEVVCSFLCVRFPNLQYWNSWVPGESLESSSDQCWYHKNPEQQCSCAHRCLLSQRVLLREPVCSPQILE